MLEVVLTAALLLGVFALAAPSFGGSGEQDATTARAAVSGALDAQIAIAARDGGFTSDTDELNGLLPRMTVVASPVGSTGPDVVSVAVSGDVVGIAVSDGTSCWLGSATSGPGGLIYAVRDSGGVCHGGVATSLELDPSQPGRGKDPTEPIEL